MKRLLIGATMSLMGLAILLYNSSSLFSCSTLWQYPQLGTWVFIGIILCFAGALLATSGGKA